jgi:hypothetical protein
MDNARFIALSFVFDDEAQAAKRENPSSKLADVEIEDLGEAYPLAAGIDQKSQNAGLLCFSARRRAHCTIRIFYAIVLHDSLL